MPRPDLKTMREEASVGCGLVICLMLNVTLIPLVIYHAVQLIADTWLADWLSRAGASPDDTSSSAGPPRGSANN